MTSANLTADALRENIKSLNAVIGKIRELHRAGKEAPKSAARYVEYLRAAHDLRETAVAAGLTGSLIDLQAPIAFRDQLVGHTEEQRRRIEWKGVFAFLGPVAAPVITKIAA
ncbi:hypothetical protein DTW90_36065 [Neorhizobium sp. P12A]|uniref:hypothetical protein n=1 Tax=Neorhizobium sp. P12A TaxID=2268027 RepID=UPI0011EC7BCD|nr:hypothetical protein [Neorhizobium sp. P12A]KAA0684557.1 hypothetical protein DTW90_36065 [Neorhizobium sp. P12A]